MFCPNCMSPHVEPLPDDAQDDSGVDPRPDHRATPPDEQIMRCTECEYAAPRSEFVPENYR
jgi:hypothetical protein